MCKVTFLIAGSEVPHSTFSQKASTLEALGQRNSCGEPVFLISHTPTEENHLVFSDMLKFESEKPKDILTWNYGDTLFNLSLKEVLFLRWMGTSCPDTKFLFKSNDDVCVNTPHILNYLNCLPKHKAEDLFTGDVISNAGPQ